jgi:hypothetical protein
MSNLTITLRDFNLYLVDFWEEGAVNRVVAAVAAVLEICLAFEESHISYFYAILISMQMLLSYLSILKRDIEYVKDRTEAGTIVARVITVVTVPTTGSVFVA